MTTDELLANVDRAKKRDDVILAYASCLPCWQGVSKQAVDAAICAKWSAAGLAYIRRKAWRVRDERVIKVIRQQDAASRIAAGVV
jgi:hypothetical protein